MGEKKYIVYVHITPNNKKYYGITSLKPEYRWNHGNGYKGCVLFYNAIRKYGWASISHKIVAHGLNREQAKRLETKLIEYFKTNNPEFGYNLTNGGDINSFSSIAIDHLRNRDYSKHYKPIICLETKEKFESIKQAKQKLKIKNNNISLCCKGIRNTVNGLHFMFVEDYNLFSDIEIGAIMSERTRGVKFRKKVRCIETGVIFSSITEASEKLGLPIANLSRVLNKKRNKVHNLSFEFI